MRGAAQLRRVEGGLIRNRKPSPDLGIANGYFLEARSRTPSSEPAVGEIGVSKPAEQKLLNRKVAAHATYNLQHGV